MFTLNRHVLFIALIAIPVLIIQYGQKAEALAPGIYCGVENCYDVLGLTRESTEREVVRTYRKLAKQYHPDLQRTEDAKKTAQETFLKIAAAYEVLRDNDSRKDYDYMLDNPEEMYRHYWQYYRRKMNVDVRIVLIITITIVSAVQYWAAWSKYNEAIDYFLTVPKYRFQAQEIAKKEGLLQSSNAALKKKNRNKSREQVRREEEQLLRKIIEEKIDIRGAYEKPTYFDVLWVQLAILPYTLFKWAVFYIRWWYKFSLRKEEYGDEEKFYLIRRNLKLSQGQWDQLEEDEQLLYFELQLWDKEKAKSYQKEQEEMNKMKLAESSSYKRYRRWMKKGGAGSITFGDD